MRLSIIVAVSENGIIGKDNQLIWHLPADLKFFKETTKGRAVIMGRKNFESIPEKFRPLPGRTNIIVSRDRNYKADGCILVHSIEDAIAYAKSINEEERNEFKVSIFTSSLDEVESQQLYFQTMGTPAND